MLRPLREHDTVSTLLWRPVKGVLLYGPPGTGKTMLAKAMAKEVSRLGGRTGPSNRGWLEPGGWAPRCSRATLCYGEHTGACMQWPSCRQSSRPAARLGPQADCYFLNITASSVLSKWYGDANKFIRAIYTLATKLEPCIIFIGEGGGAARSSCNHPGPMAGSAATAGLPTARQCGGLPQRGSLTACPLPVRPDEVDAFLTKRGGASEHEATLSAKTEFMQLWDGIEGARGMRVLVMGATNRRVAGGGARCNVAGLSAPVG